MVMNRILSIGGCMLFIAACNPTIRVEAPSEPIRIEANITIKHEIRIVIEKEVEAIFDDEEGLF